jgi:hypothetical protein
MLKIKSKIKVILMYELLAKKRRKSTKDLTTVKVKKIKQNDKKIIIKKLYKNICWVKNKRISIYTSKEIGYK